MKRPLIIDGVQSDLILCDISKFGGHDLLIASSHYPLYRGGVTLLLSFEIEPYVALKGLFRLIEDPRHVRVRIGEWEYRYNFAGELNAVPAIPAPIEKPKRPPLDRWKLVN